MIDRWKNGHSSTPKIFNIQFTNGRPRKNQEKFIDSELIDAHIFLHTGDLFWMNPGWHSGFRCLFKFTATAVRPHVHLSMPRNNTCDKSDRPTGHNNNMPRREAHSQDVVLELFDFNSLFLTQFGCIRLFCHLCRGSSPSDCNLSSPLSLHNIALAYLIRGNCPATSSSHLLGYAFIMCIMCCCRRRRDFW